MAKALVEAEGPELAAAAIPEPLEYVQAALYQQLNVSSGLESFVKVASLEGLDFSASF